MTVRFVRVLLLILATTGILAPATSAYAQLTKKKMVSMLDDIDRRQRALGDYKALMYLEYKEKGKSDLVYQAVTYRRDAESKFVFMFLKPKTAAGLGYLVLDGNLFYYAPSVGRWERRTERERFGGTDSRRQDFDMKNLSRDYVPSYVGEEKLGKFKVHHLKLKAKKKAKVAFPILHLWLDTKTNNPLKEQDVAKSGKLLRTLYYPKWEKISGEKRKGKFYFPREIRIYDELQKGNQTIIVIQKVELKELPDNIFTKAWVESKSR
jgi:outer membrane lipoprotein-sorting protein